MNTRAPVLAAAAAICACLAACADTVTCPAGTIQIGSYTATYTVIDEGDTCIVSVLPDGGATNSLLVTTPASNSLLLCASGQDGGTTQLYLGSSLLGAPDASTYAASGSDTDVGNTACLCGIDIVDTLSITIATADGGSFAFGADGGYTNVPSFTGRVDDEFTHNASDTSVCGCNVPCGAHYSLTATTATQ